LQVLLEHGQPLLHAEVFLTDVAEVDVAAVGGAHSTHHAGHGALSRRQHGEYELLEQRSSTAGVHLAADHDQVSDDQRREDHATVARGIDDTGHRRFRGRLADPAARVISQG